MKNLSITSVASSWMWEGCTDFFFMLNKSGSFSFSFTGQVLQPLIVLVDHCCDILINVLWGLKLDVIWLILVMVWSLVRVAMLLLMQLGILLAILSARDHCRLWFGLLFTKTWRSFSVRLPSQFPACIIYYSPAVGLCSLLNVERFLFAHSLNLPTCGTLARPLSISA